MAYYIRKFVHKNPSCIHIFHANFYNLFHYKAYCIVHHLICTERLSKLSQRNKKSSPISLNFETEHQKRFL